MSPIENIHRVLLAVNVPIKYSYTMYNTIELYTTLLSSGFKLNDFEHDSYMTNPNVLTNATNFDIYIYICRN